MYVSFVLVVFKFFRTAFIEGRMVKVYVEELPCVDHVLVLFDHLFMAREMKDYWLEEELVAKIIFIFRNSDVLFRFTRMQYEPTDVHSYVSSHRFKFPTIFNLYEQLQGKGVFATSSKTHRFFN